MAGVARSAPGWLLRDHQSRRWSPGLPDRLGPRQLHGCRFAAIPQTVSGAAALAFVRQHHGLPRGDLDRTLRQQAHLSGLAHQLLSAHLLTNPGAVAALRQAITRYVVIDPGWDLAGLLKRAASLQAEAIQFRPIPTGRTDLPTPDGQAVQINPEQVHQFIAPLTNRTDQLRHPPSVTAPVFAPIATSLPCVTARRWNKGEHATSDLEHCHALALDRAAALPREFRLRGRDRAVVDLRGITTVPSHAEDLVGRRLAPAEPRSDGRQTPYRGHPVFVAQHALPRRAAAPAWRALDDAERGYVAEAICRWIAGQYAPDRPLPPLV